MAMCSALLSVNCWELWAPDVVVTTITDHIHTSPAQYLSYSAVCVIFILSSWFSRAPRCPCRWTGSRGPRVPARSPSPIRPRPSCCTTAPSRRTMTTTNPAPLRQRVPPLKTHPGHRGRPLLVHDPPWILCDVKLLLCQFLSSSCSLVSY